MDNFIPKEGWSRLRRKKFEHYITHPKMGWVVVWLNEINTPPVRKLKRYASQSLIDDLLLGQRRGRFLIQMDDFLIDGILGINGGVIRERLDGNNDSQLADRATELVLRLLGISESEARWSSRRYTRRVNQQ